ncbi:MAG: rhodanese-like domain-containing protein [Bacteroidetes bacterium]|nr:rhodanese-like domain-containing protein [Bacteroidota bacterium]MBL7067379.1 rhodanese-like domain-containing protein [Candidatus Neomarinimicrobiota bacterium]
MNPTNPIFRIFYRSVCIFMIALCCSLLFNLISPKGLPLITSYRKISIGDKTHKIPLFQTRSFRKDKSSTGQVHVPEEIQLKNVLFHYENSSAIFIDTRNHEDYTEGHIPRAISIPLESFDFKSEILSELSKDQGIITYCDGEECSQSIDMAVYLEELGFTNVYFFIEGWLEWQESGYPISEGDQP